MPIQINPFSRAFDVVYTRIMRNIQYLDFDTSSTVTSQEGRLYWDKDNGSLSVGLPGGVVVLQIGQEQLTRVKNDQGAEIGNGKAVYVSGSSGVNPKVKLASNASLATASVIGLATETIDAGQFGYVCSGGLVRDLDTDSFNAGDWLWLNASNGTLTNTRPESPLTQVFVGIVMSKGSGNGIIAVRPIIVQRLSTLSDVYAPSVSDGDILAYNDSNNRFEIASGVSAITVSLDDDEEYNIGAVTTFSDGFVLANDATKSYASFISDTSDVIVLVGNNATNADTDTFLCLYISGGDLILKNRLGATYSFLLKYDLR